MPSYIKKSLSSYLAKLSVWLPKQWSRVSWLQWALLPIAIIFFLLVQLRRFLYHFGLLSSESLDVPVIVVGNITVGGSGKTPLTIALAKSLQSQGLHPGIVSRGYARQGDEITYVDGSSNAREAGDEPLLLAVNTQCPVFVGADRVAAAKALLKNNPECDVIISDDGLQHYRLSRQFEIAVVDGERGFGNQWMLPAGPLREPVNRLSAVDALVVNSGIGTQLSVLSQWTDKVFEMRLRSREFYRLTNHHHHAPAALFKHKKILAVAGIGHPERFFKLLTQLGVVFEKKAFPDHHQFTPYDFAQLEAEVILMTEKDAVKCLDIADERFWVLPIEAELDQGLITLIAKRLTK